MLRELFVRLHGEGSENQLDVYRCQGCSRLVTWNMIRSGKRCCSGRVVPTQPSFLETLKLFLLPWTF
jgi:hypothetical protein